MGNLCILNEFIYLSSSLIKLDPVVMMEKLLDLEENKHDRYFYEVGCFSR